tara:strand:- start:2012 stop:2578 length:567 start_codon:yes stop_codon:yes gene_type:complete
MQSERKIAQYLLGFLNSSHYVLINLSMGWGSFSTLRYTIPVFIGYNIIDTLLGQYWKKNKIMLLHHFLSLSACKYALTFDSFSPNQYLLLYWLSTAEISSIFNCSRYFFRDTKWETPLDIAFATSFLILRPLSVYKTFTPIYNLPYFRYALPFWLIYTGLNGYWIYAIFKKSKRIKKSYLKIFGKFFN